MSAKAARKYHYNQAKGVAESLQIILRRINPKYTPLWLIKELEKLSHTAQCIQAERRRDMEGFRD